MAKIVINCCHGGFSLSSNALQEYRRRKGDENIDDLDIARDDPILVEIVETMGSDANTRFSDLKIVEIPDGVNWFIQEYDGDEWVAERHRTWR